MSGKVFLQDAPAAEKFSEGRDISQPCGNAHAGDHLRVTVQTSKNLVISVHDHDDAQCHTHDEKGERLQAFEITQSHSPERWNRLPQACPAGKKSGGREKTIAVIPEF